ncbi:uncharacterized protein [Venturia canescens]|uniref:uncharacterized protein isoform X2 n=1 Tax=Venturia canescens TaxID=32260 RepID=UPI001C9C2B35|nr:uncharacterized protein LOC122418970 isoform X2 [Venturia canescens]
MDVPVFPAPPTLDGAGTTLRKVPDVGTTTITNETIGDDDRTDRHVPLSGGNTIIGIDSSAFANDHRHRRRRFHRVGRFVNSIHPKITRETDKTRARITEFRVKMTERREDDDDEDDADVVCASVTPPADSVKSRTMSADSSIRAKDEIMEERRRATRTTGIQTDCAGGPYRLKVLPSLRDFAAVDTSTENSDRGKKSWRICWHLRFLGRLSLCLAWLLIFWTMTGAASFYATEGPREREQVLELKDMQRDLAVGLATELRQLKAEEQEMEPLWSNKVRQYVVKHEKLLLAAVNSGYGEGGDGAGQLWTFPGCILFSISLITTLGFGAPVPRTTPGRTVAVVFAAIGIPAHFLLILNLGLLLAMRLQRYAVRRKYNLRNGIEKSEMTPVPKWVKVVPFCCIGVYYTIGILCFGAARSRPFAASLLFPLDFTAAGGLATTSGLVRIMYGIYLEGAVTIAAVAVAVLRVSATQSLTNIGLKYGLLTGA